MPIIEDVVTALGYELVDVEYKTLYGDKHLIVYIASEKGVSLDDCETVSNALDAPLDALDPTSSMPYCLDVSSPGLDRPFKSQRDYERNYGSKVEVKLFAPIDGSKQKAVRRHACRAHGQRGHDRNGRRKHVNRKRQNRACQPVYRVLTQQRKLFLGRKIEMAKKKFDAHAPS